MRRVVTCCILLCRGMDLCHLLEVECPTAKNGWKGLPVMVYPRDKWINTIWQGAGILGRETKKLLVNSPLFSRVCSAQAVPKPSNQFSVLESRMLGHVPAPLANHGKSIFSIVARTGCLYASCNLRTLLYFLWCKARYQLKTPRAGRR